jgi:hypothetical protein
MLKIIISLIIIILLIILLNTTINKQTPPNSSLYFVDVDLPNKDVIKKLETKLKIEGTRLNPELNFNNAQGKKLNYLQLPEEIINFYENSNILDIVSNTLGKKVTFADKTEKYRIFARIYEDENDFLEWHYDNNFTIGERYTLVIPIICDKCNTSEFMIRNTKTKEITVVPIPTGKGIVYNGSVTNHKISKQTNGCRRMVVIIPLYTNYKKNIVGNVSEYVRNIVFKKLSL